MDNSDCTTHFDPLSSSCDVVELKKFTKKRNRNYRSIQASFINTGEENPSFSSTTTTACTSTTTTITTTFPTSVLVSDSSTSKEDDTNQEEKKELSLLPRGLFNDLKEVRKIRSRPRGIDAQLLLKPSITLDNISSAPTNSNEKNSTNLTISLAESQQNDAEGLLSGFTSVNKTLDANQHMEKFIEEELGRKRRKLVTPAVSEMEATPTLNHLSQPSLLEDELFTVPEHLQIVKPEITEGSVTVSASMLTTIPEVNLGPETKLKAMEQTENFRDKLRALHMSSNSQLRERALAFHNNPYPSMRWRISRKTRESLYDLQVADEILHEHALPLDEENKPSVSTSNPSSSVSFSDSNEKYVS